MKILALCFLVLCSCTTTSQLSSLATPANVQISITVLGSAASSKLTAQDKLILHTFAVDLLKLTSATVDSAAISGVVPAIPASASPFLNPLIQTALVELNLALAKFGSHNVQIVAYCQAVGNGLLGAGF